MSVSLISGEAVRQLHPQEVGPHGYGYIGEARSLPRRQSSLGQCRWIACPRHCHAASTIHTEIEPFVGEAIAFLQELQTVQHYAGRGSEAVVFALGMVQIVRSVVKEKVQLETEPHRGCEIASTATEAGQEFALLRRYRYGVWRSERHLVQIGTVRGLLQGVMFWNILRV